MHDSTYGKAAKTGKKFCQMLKDWQCFIQTPKHRRGNVREETAK